MNSRPAKARKQLAAFASDESSSLSMREKIMLSPDHARPPVGVVTGSKQPDHIPANASPPPSCTQAMTPNPQTKNHDTETVSFFHQFPPPTATAQTRRHTKAGATYLPANTARAAALLMAVMERYRPAEPLTGPVRLSLLWTFPGSVVAVVPKVTRPDLDNLAKLALDAMTRSGYWRDDAQVVEFTTAKFAGPIPGMAVTVTRWTPAKAEQEAVQ